MIKRILIVLAVVLLLATAANRAIAQAPVTIYVDPFRKDGNEDGSMNHPYSMQTEGVAYLQAQPSGGDLVVKNQDGTWAKAVPVKPVKPGTPGIPLPAGTLYLLLAVLALILVTAGWTLQRRSQRLRV